MKRLICLLMAGAAAFLLSACSKDGWQEGDTWYDMWATGCFFGNGVGGSRSSFLLDIKQGETADGETLVAGMEMYLLLAAPPVTDGRIPSGSYVVSEDSDRDFVLKKGLANLADGSYLAFCDRPPQKWQRFPIESGSVRIDQHESTYDVRLNVVAGGGYYEYHFIMEVLEFSTE